MRLSLTILIFTVLLTSCSSPANNEGKESITQSEETTEKQRPLGNYTEDSLMLKKTLECDSVHTLYYSNGRLREMGCFYKGKRHGMWKINEITIGGSDLEITIFYKNGVNILELDSLWVKDRCLLSTDSFVYHNTDTFYLQSKSYYKNGKYQKITSSKGGPIHGYSRIWLENGTLISEELVNHGIGVYHKRFNHQNGKISEHEIYDKEGYLKTKQFFYSDIEKVRLERHYKPKKKGMYPKEELVSEKEFDQSGKLKLERTYKDEKLVSEKKY